MCSARPDNRQSRYGHFLWQGGGGGPGHTDLPLSDRTRLKRSGGVASFSLTARVRGMACRVASDKLQQLLGMPKRIPTMSTHTHTRLYYFAL